MGASGKKILRGKSNNFLEAKKKIKKTFKVFLSDERHYKLSVFLYRIKQLLNTEERKYIKNIALSKRICQPKETKAKVIILGLRTFSTHNLSVFDKVLSDSLRHNGADAKVLICDNILESCDIRTIGDLPQKVFCHKCKMERKQYKKMYGNDYLSFSQFISLEEIEQARKIVSLLDDKDLINFSYMDVNISLHAIDSTIKYFRKSNFNPENSRHLEVMRHNILQGVISVKVAKNLVDAEKPTHLISLHGCYVSWGPFYDYCKKNKIHVVRYSKAIHKIGYFAFVTYGRFATIEDKNLWSDYREKELSLRQKEEVKEFLYKKKDGKTLDYKLYNTGKEKYAGDVSLQKIMNSNKCKKYVLYANILWDANLEYSGSNIFKDVYDWMFCTIEYFAKLKNHYLLVKPHPGEASVAYTEKGVNEVIIEHFGKLPENIVLIPKDYPITSFDLMEKECVGITYNGTTGLEHSFFQKPILVGGDISYVDAGAAMKINSRQEYFNFIINPQPLYEYPRQNFDLIERYAYFYYFKLIVPIPFFKKDVWLGHCVDWDKLSDYENFVRKDKVMNHIAASIIRKQAVVCPEDVF
ncbi:MAG: hypothetical protein ABH872_07475 [Candidatus Omnitrophota bacterium]